MEMRKGIQVKWKKNNLIGEVIAKFVSDHSSSPEILYIQFKGSVTNIHDGFGVQKYRLVAEHLRLWVPAEEIVPILAADDLLN